jgi:uncharacterized protein (TIGR04141 family)
MKLNIYLFKESVASFNHCIKSSTSERPYQSIRGEHTLSGVEYEVYLIRGKPKEPDWVKFIRNHVDETKLNGIKNKINSALIVLKTDTIEGNRFFAISCGYGHHYINKEMIEFDFGLLTSLNCIEPNKIKSIESRSLGVQVIQNHEASNAEARIDEFGFEFDSDILRSVSGVCSDNALGSHIAGSDNLCITAKISFLELADRCRESFAKYNLNIYQQNFKFIEFLKYEKDPSIISSLDEYLADSINERKSAPHISIAFPDQIEYERCNYYEFKGMGRKEVVGDITLTEFYRYLDDNDIDLAKIKNGIKITGFDESSNPCTTSESLYSFLTFEKEQDDKRYILCNGRWYYIKTDYVHQIESKLAEMIQPCENPILKSWPMSINSKGKNGYTEGFYNKLYENDPEYLYLDKDLFNFGRGYGHSSSEIADIFHRSTNKLFFVKKLNGSATLSHLFSQGSVSADLFSDFRQYQDIFLDRVNSKWPGDIFDQEKLKLLIFVYAIGTDKDADLIDTLPIFSKINLLKHTKIISKLNHKVELAKIKMISDSASD